MAAAGLKLHELVALCAAALRPSREIWEAFVRELRKLEASGQITSDESVAIIVSELSDIRLGELQDEEERKESGPNQAA